MNIRYYVETEENCSFLELPLPGVPGGIKQRSFLLRAATLLPEVFLSSPKLEIHFGDIFDPVFVVNEDGKEIARFTPALEVPSELLRERG